MYISWRRSVVLISASSLFTYLCLGAERGAEYVEPFLQLIVGNGQRHQGADDVVVHAAAKGDQAVVARFDEDLRGLFVGGLFGLAVADELHAHHGAEPADLTYKLVLARPRSHALL